MGGAQHAARSALWARSFEAGRAPTRCRSRACLCAAFRLWEFGLTPHAITRTLAGSLSVDTRRAHIFTGTMHSMIAHGPFESWGSPPALHAARPSGVAGHRVFRMRRILLEVRASTPNYDALCEGVCSASMGDVLSARIDYCAKALPKPLKQTC